jgi:hypothetical protein
LRWRLAHRSTLGILIQEKRGNMRKTIALAMMCLMLAATVAFAEDMGGPPKILQIGREEVKVGKGAAHTAYEAKWTAAVKAKSKTNYLGMVSMNTNEAWWITGYDSFAAMEKENAAIDSVQAQFGPGDAEYINSSRGMIARFRDDLSYNVGGPLGDAHGFTVTTVRVRPGHNNEYEELRKAVKAGFTKANVTAAHFAVYQVVVGAPGGTFLVFSPFKSLAERDVAMAAPRIFTDEEDAKLNDLASKSVISSEPQIFTFSPKMSNPSAQMVAAAPEFWTPKPVMAKAKAPAGDAKTATAAKTTDKSKEKTGK